MKVAGLDCIAVVSPEAAAQGIFCLFTKDPSLWTLTNTPRVSDVSTMSSTPTPLSISTT